MNHFIAQGHGGKKYNFVPLLMQNEIHNILIEVLRRLCAFEEEIVTSLAKLYALWTTQLFSIKN